MDFRDRRVLISAVVLIAILVIVVVVNQRASSGSTVYYYKDEGLQFIANSGKVDAVLITNEAAPGVDKRGLVNTYGFMLGMSLDQVKVTAQNQGFAIEQGSDNSRVLITPKTNVTFEYDTNLLVKEIGVDGDFGNTLGFTSGCSTSDMTKVLGSPDAQIRLDRM